MEWWPEPWCLKVVQWVEVNKCQIWVRFNNSLKRISEKRTTKNSRKCGGTKSKHPMHSHYFLKIYKDQFWTCGQEWLLSKVLNSLISSHIQEWMQPPCKWLKRALKMCLLMSWWTYSKRETCTQQINCQLLKCTWWWIYVWLIKSKQWNNLANWDTPWVVVTIHQEVIKEEDHFQTLNNGGRD